MKILLLSRTFFLLTIIYLFCFSECRKKNIIDVPGLPPATQQGKNTLGFLLNGVPWIPKGFNGTSNLTIDLDPGIDDGIFTVNSYRVLSNTNREYFGFGIKDSLNFITSGMSFKLGQGSLFGVYFSFPDCMLDYFDSAIVRTGSMTISKYDKQNRIISGTFTANLIKNGCKEIRITEGRFDMKF
ncbi:MAG: hypothetical protein ACOVRK_06250 [Chryseobacterium taeanense]